MDDIATHVGFGKSSIYYYYQSKKDLLWRIFEFIMDWYLNKARERVGAGQSPEQMIAELIRQHILFLAAYKDCSIVFVRCAAELSQDRQREVVRRAREYTDLLESAFRRGIESGVFKNVSADIAINGILGMCNWMITWYDEQRHGPAITISDRFIALRSGGYGRA